MLLLISSFFHLLIIYIFAFNANIDTIFHKIQRCTQSTYLIMCLPLFRNSVILVIVKTLVCRTAVALVFNLFHTTSVATIVCSTGGHCQSNCKSNCGGGYSLNLHAIISFRICYIDYLEYLLLISFILLTSSVLYGVCDNLTVYVLLGLSVVL